MSLVFANFDKEANTYVDQISYSTIQEAGVRSIQLDQPTSGLSYTVPDPGNLVDVNFTEDNTVFQDVISRNDIQATGISAIQLAQPTAGLSYTVPAFGELVDVNFTEDNTVFRDVISIDDDKINNLQKKFGHVQILETTVQTTEISLGQYWVG